MVKRALLLTSCFLCWLPPLTFSQTSRVLPWQLPLPEQNPLAYRPEPVLFVHGINANDAGWQTALDTLRPIFSAYQPLNIFPIDTSRERATQYAYLHTFNYGDPPGQSTLNRQAFDHIEWNAWADDRDYEFFTNTFTRAIELAPHDGRLTLDERINGSGTGVTGIREAYAITINGVTTEPSISLVAHSMGGVLSHYYLIQSAPDTGVRRLVTLATPHQGHQMEGIII